MSDVYENLWGSGQSKMRKHRRHEGHKSGPTTGVILEEPSLWDEVALLAYGTRTSMRKDHIG